jgi:hypothetical protein
MRKNPAIVGRSRSTRVRKVRLRDRRRRRAVVPELRGACHRAALRADPVAYPGYRAMTTIVTSQLPIDH